MKTSIAILLSSVALCCAIMLLFSACATPGPIAAGTAGFLVALDQMLAAGSVTPEQYSVIRESFNALQSAVNASSQWSPEGIGGTVLATGTAAWLAYLKAKNGAVQQIRQERGPAATAEERIERLRKQQEE